MTQLRYGAYGPPGRRMNKFLRTVWKFRAVYVLVLPGLVWYALFSYLPMGGLSLAFKVYKAKLGIWASPWNGVKNFEYVFRDASFWASISRTIVINFCRLLFEFPAPIILALMLNELRIGRLKKIMQSVYTFPHFLSWVIVASIMTNLLSFEGFVNSAVVGLGGQATRFLGREDLFQPMLHISSIWKNAGYSAIIYMAAISGIDVDQYEAAEIDGASRMQRLAYVTLPNLVPTISVLFVLTAGNLMSAGFDQVFNLNNAAVKNVAETLDMYIYRVTFQSAADFGFSTAVSLFRSVCNMILLLCANFGSKALGGSGLMA